jgi:hypothetical protein
MRRSHSQSGKERDGSTTKIRAGGFNGIAAITWDGAVRMTNGKSDVGVQCVVTSLKLRSTVLAKKPSAVLDSDKRYCIGRMTHAKSERCTD